MFPHTYLLAYLLRTDEAFARCQGAECHARLPKRRLRPMWRRSKTIIESAGPNSISRRSPILLVKIYHIKSISTQLLVHFSFALVAENLVSHPIILLLAKLHLLWDASVTKMWESWNGVCSALDYRRLRPAVLFAKSLRSLRFL